MSTTSQAATLPTTTQKTTVAAGVGTVAVALVTFFTVFKVVDWSAAQTALVTAEAAAIVGLVAALAAHFRLDTPKEPVAVAATLTATVSATLALGSGFAWWSFTVQQTSAVAGMVTAVLGVGGAVLARRHVSAKVSSSNK